MKCYDVFFLFQATFKDDSGPEGEVWTTLSEISHLMFGIILAAAMPSNSSYKLTPSEAYYNDTVSRTAHACLRFRLLMNE